MGETKIQYVILCFPRFLRGIPIRLRSSGGGMLERKGWRRVPD